MEPFRNLSGIVVPLDRANVDTDAIMPKQFLKAIGRTGFGANLFDEWRYLDRGEPGQDCSRRPLNPDFVLNDARYRGARVFLARDNFGCGSSREHAVWALLDYGIRCVIAPSFAEIFFSNCCKNGLLAIRLPAEVMDRLFSEVLSEPGFALTIDLAGQTVARPDGQILHFEIDPGIKRRLLLGLDDIAMTLQSADDIRRFEVRRRTEAAWLFRE
ncbi:MAG: 3-isopropylmalate dehydratase small subunit [Gammaproteobacteria bacterium]